MSALAFLGCTNAIRLAGHEQDRNGWLLLVSRWLLRSRWECHFRAIYASAILFGPIVSILLVTVIVIYLLGIPLDFVLLLAPKLARHLFYHLQTICGPLGIPKMRVTLISFQNQEALDGFAKDVFLTHFLDAVNESTFVNEIATEPLLAPPAPVSTALPLMFLILILLHLPCLQQAERRHDHG